MLISWEWLADYVTLDAPIDQVVDRWALSGLNHESTEWVEGVPVVSWTDTRAPNENPRKGLRTEAGTIMLQGHDPGSEVEFRSLLISPL